MSGGGTAVRMAVLAVLWGSTFLWIKLALEGFSPAVVTVVRCGLGAAVLLGLAVAARQRLPRGGTTWGRVTVAALLCNAVPFALFAVGERTVDSGVAGVVNPTTPLWSLVIGLATGTERGARPGRLAGLLVGFAGTVLIFAPWTKSGLLSWGALALLGAAVSYAVAFAYMGRKLVGSGTEPLALSAAQLVAATGLSALALPFGSGAPHVTVAAVVAVVVLGVFGTGVTFHLNYRLIATEGATTAATVGYLLPVVSVVLGAVVLHEEIGPRVVAGMVVVLAGVALSRHQPKRVPVKNPALCVKET
ncbi:DMT family transporter [Amycolatopsis sp. NPDC051903]|uniref:DMT family transporter n=1 Tax=Amycolatopsis sp. NPDC051903 TaxID=3363936 RepID=UPI0037945B93